MKGKYINTTIMIAALSGGKRKRTNNATETLATINDHKIIWSKNNPTKTAAIAETKTAFA